MSRETERNLPNSSMYNACNWNMYSIFYRKRSSIIISILYFSKIIIFDLSSALYLQNHLDPFDLKSTSVLAVTQLHFSGGYFMSDLVYLTSYPKGFQFAIDDKKSPPPQGSYKIISCNSI